MPSLLHPRLVREHFKNVALPADLDRRCEVIRGWTRALRSGELADANEVHLHGEFLTGVFGDVLGYRMRTTAASDGSYDLGAEVELKPIGKVVDGAIGFFGIARRHMVAPIELKGAGQALDTRKGRERTPVEQAWEYASLAPESRWIIVSNYAETRLYSKGRGWGAYEVFRLEDLDTEEDFVRFYGLLSRDVVLGAEPGARSTLDALLEAGTTEQQQITDRLYRDYRDIRRELFADLCRHHSNWPPLDLLPFAQTILDRVLFCAFAEDRGLIPSETIVRALDVKNPYDPNWTRWRALCGVFRGVDKGSRILGLPPLNGGLFREDSRIGELEVSDKVCERFRDIATYDFAEDVSVEVLGHIFEQSVSELEELRADAAEQRLSDTQRTPSKRRAEGVFYTPNFVTRFLVDLTLAEAFRERETAAFASVYGAGVRRSRGRDLEAWEKYREGLRSLRVLDPACGSGAFLIAAFEAMEREYDRVNRALAALREGQIEVFDLTTSVLNENLFGLDLNGESVEITKLSLWLKTARKNKQLTYLDRNIRRGNTVVDDAMVDPWAFDWEAGRTAETLLEPEPVNAETAAEIDARWREKFDVVLGNPPYVRQELLTKFKPHWQERFACYDGVADLFVYFFERGISELKPGGRLGFIVSNKWLRAGYAEKLRGWLAAKTEIERIVDFGHAPIFPDADAFPCIITVRKLAAREVVAGDHQVSVTQFPREELSKAEVPIYVAEHTEELPQAKLLPSGWTLATGGDQSLYEKLRARGRSLKKFVGSAPLYGLKTGLNDAFLLDTPTRDRLVREDPGCAELLKKYLRGQDISRWSPEWDGQWMVQLASSGDKSWPWSGLPEDKAEASFGRTFPSLYGFMKPQEAKLRKRTDRGRYWWELRSCAYYDQFARPKIVYQEIQFHPRYALDDAGSLLNNKAFMITSASRWLLAVLNSPLMWWFNWRYLPHMKDEALTPKGELLEDLPIAEPTTAQLQAAEEHVEDLLALTSAIQTQRAAVLDVLRIQHGIEKPGTQLSTLDCISSDDFIREVIKRRPKKLGSLSAAGQLDLRRLFAEDVEPLRVKRASIRDHERALAKVVNEAYGLTAADEVLLWDSAPPRMPDAR
jgi:hypothetical protein